jgi:hypothetical protein
MSPRDALFHLVSGEKIAAFLGQDSLSRRAIAA